MSLEHLSSFFNSKRRNHEGADQSPSGGNLQPTRANETWDTSATAMMPQQRSRRALLCAVIVCEPLLVRPPPSRGLDSLKAKSKAPGPVNLPLEGVILSLQDLIFYFRPPEEELEHEEKQTKLRSLRNRQNLFQEEVPLASLNYPPLTSHYL